MDTREFFLKTFEAETPKFVRVLKAVPEGQPGYRPHPRSTCTSDLVWLLASELRDACELTELGILNFSSSPAPATIGESIVQYERNAADLQRRVAALSAGGWDKPAKFLVNGQVAWEAPL